MNILSIYTDGSCINNGKKNPIGAIGVFINDNSDYNVSRVIFQDKITNQTMELQAAITGLELCDNLGSFDVIYLYTDSMYLINSMTKWYDKWSSNNWKKSNGKDVDNLELIQKLYTLKNKYYVIFKHIKSHQDKPDKDSRIYDSWYGNFMADKLAQQAVKDYLISLKTKIIDDTINEISTDTNIKKKKIKNIIV
jgi:ribonuclease HI